MPQFDFFSFFVQIFWLLIGVCLLHLLYLKFLMSGTSNVMKMRDRLNAARINSLKLIKTKTSVLYDTIIKWFK